MTATKYPTGLRDGGRSLWESITDDHDLDAAQTVQLEEACRAKDRLDQLDEVLRGDSDTWMRLVRDIRADGEVFELRMTQALTQANATANLMKQLLAALRLPDPQSGKKPQYRGARGAVAPQVPGGKPGKVSSLDRARAAKSG
jgi:hypothetical protein